MSAEYCPNPRFEIVGVNYVTLYIASYEAATQFYTRVFGPPEDADPKMPRHGWRLGRTWLTVFRGGDENSEPANPRNVEFAIECRTPAEVDRLHAALVAAGAKNGWDPRDTWMYEPMRFAYVDDPFGMRIDIYCPLPASS